MALLKIDNTIEEPGRDSDYLSYIFKDLILRLLTVAGIRTSYRIAINILHK